MDIHARAHDKSTARRRADGAQLDRRTARRPRAGGRARPRPHLQLPQRHRDAAGNLRAGRSQRGGDRRAVLHAPPGPPALRIQPAQPDAGDRRRLLGGGGGRARRQRGSLSAVGDAAEPAAQGKRRSAPRRLGDAGRARQRPDFGDGARPRRQDAGRDHHDLLQQPAGAAPVDRHRRARPDDDRGAGRHAHQCADPGVAVRRRGRRP